MTIITIRALEELYKNIHGELKNKFFDNYEIHNYETLNSTMDIVKKNILKREKLNHIIMTDFQEKGHGRFERKWYSSRKENLLVSIPIVLKKELSPYVPIILSLSIFQTIKSFVDDCDLKIKWPNDILLNSKKISGMIIENTIEENYVFINFGVGINVNSNLDDLSGKGFVATSLFIEQNKKFDLNQIIYLLLINISKNLKYNKEIYINWKSNLYLPKKKVYLNTDSDAEYEISSIDEFGNLIVYFNGQELTLSADEISFQD